MPDESSISEQSTEESHDETAEEEYIEDIAERIDRQLTELLERVASIESELASIRGGYDERFNGIDARFNTAFTGGTPTIPPDHGPEPTHWYFRRVGGKQF